MVETDQQKAKDGKAATISGFSASKFGWKSNTPSLNGFLAGSVEVQEDLLQDKGSQFGEIISEDVNYAIYQDVAVTPGEKMTWKLDHAPRGYRDMGNQHAQLGRQPA